MVWVLYTKAILRLELLKELRCVSYGVVSHKTHLDSYHALAPTHNMADVRLWRTTLPAVKAPIRSFYYPFIHAWRRDV